MISSSQLSLFSLKAQKQLLDKYGILISHERKESVETRVYQLNKTFFKVYEYEKNNKSIIKITPANKILL